MEKKRTFWQSQLVAMWAGVRANVPVVNQAEDGIRDDLVTGVQTCALPISFGGMTTLPRLPKRSGTVSSSRLRVYAIWYVRRRAWRFSSRTVRPRYQESPTE